MTLRKLLGLAIAVLIGAAVIWRSLPPGPAPLVIGGHQASNPPLRGAFHVHTTRSDGTGDPDGIAAAAARAGLQFVVFTDHGDGTRAADPPLYRHGVLCLDGVEISTTGGHYIALGIPVAPYPLAGEPGDVVEDVGRLGGFGVVAHPGSPKPELRWREWSAPFDAVEWLNADSEWRDEGRGAIARAIWQYSFRGPQALASLLNRPKVPLARWDALTRRRHVVALAGTDAHARIGSAFGPDPYRTSAFIKLPSYEVSFRTFSIRLQTAGPLTGRASDDAALVMEALRKGHAFTSIDALADAGAFDFTGTSGANSASEGDDLLIDGPVHLSVSADLPAGASIVLLRNGKAFSRTTGTRMDEIVPPKRAVYRVEIRLPPSLTTVPWIVSNPIYVVSSSNEPREARGGPPAKVSALVVAADVTAKVERDAASTAVPRLTAEGSVGLQYRLGSRDRGPYAALALPLDRRIQRFDRLTFEGVASRPCRLSVQLRARSQGGERWHRSVYLDSTPRTVTIFFDEMVAAGQASVPAPSLQTIDTVLFVVDTVNSRPGDEGTFDLAHVRFER